MRIFKTAYFHRFAENEGLSDTQIKEAIVEMEKGLIDGDLGANLFKKRIAIGDRGKRGGLRSIIAYKRGDKAIFIYGYPKNMRDNISIKEKEAYKKLSKSYFCLNDLSLRRLLKIGELIEVKNE